MLVHAYLAAEDRTFFEHGGIDYPGLIGAVFEPGRSTDDKISAVQYLRFPLAAADHQALATVGTRVAIAIDHPNYQHVAEGRDRIIADRMALMAEPGVVQSGEDVDRPPAES